MDDLKKLLNRFKESLEGDAALREKVALVIKGECGFDLRLEDIKIRKDELSINTTPPKKSEIKLHGKEILEKLRQNGLKISRIY